MLLASNHNQVCYISACVVNPMASQSRPVFYFVLYNIVHVQFDWFKCILNQLNIPILHCSDGPILDDRRPLASILNERRDLTDTSPRGHATRLGLGPGLLESGFTGLYAPSFLNQQQSPAQPGYVIIPGYMTSHCLIKFKVWDLGS